MSIGLADTLLMETIKSIANKTAEKIYDNLNANTFKSFYTVNTLERIMRQYLEASFKHFRNYKPVLNYGKGDSSIDLYDAFIVPCLKCGLLDERERNDFLNDAKNNQIKNTISGNDTCLLNTDKNLTIIYGTAGTGKSSLMKYLFLESLSQQSANSKIEYLPIFIELFEFSSDDTLTSFKDLIIKTLKRYGCGLDDELYKVIFEKVNLIYFLDGYDEIAINKSFSSRTREHFLYWIKNNYANGKGDKFFVSTRILDDIKDLHYQIYSICPLSLDQAAGICRQIRVIGEDEQRIQESFLCNLRKHLYYEHITLTTNPLFLSLLFKRYLEGNMNKNYKLYALLEDIYKSLYADVNRYKGHRRQLYTDDKDFENILSLFCYFCFKDGRITAFNHNILTKKLEEVRNSELNVFGGSTKKIDFDIDGFIQDLLETTILRKSADFYYFSHVLFQEFFTMVLLTRQYSDNIGSLGVDLIKSNPYISTFSSVFTLVHEKAPNSFKETIIYPLLLDIENENGKKFTVDTNEDVRYDFYFEKMITSLEFVIAENRIEFGKDLKEYLPINFIVKYMDTDYDYDLQIENPKIDSESKTLNCYRQLFNDQHKNYNGHYLLDYNELRNNKEGYDLLKETWVGKRVKKAAILGKKAREKRNNEIISNVNKSTTEELKLILSTIQSKAGCLVPESLKNLHTPEKDS